LADSNSTFINPCQSGYRMYWK